jgi:nitroreductase
MNSDCNTALNWRYATKKFDATKKISEAQMAKIEESLVLTPSSFGLQPWKFMIITNTELRKNLQAISWNQPQVVDCSHFVVFFAKNSMTEPDINRFIDSMVQTRGVPAANLEAYRQQMIGTLKNRSEAELKHWAKLQTYIALGQLMTVAALMEIDSCPMEGIDATKYDETLKVTGYHASVACALGYRSSEDVFGNAKKVRFATDEIILRRP